MSEEEIEENVLAAKTLLERLFIERLLVLYLGSAFGEPWVSKTIKNLLQLQINGLREAGFNQHKIQALFNVLESWNGRFYGLNFTYTDSEVGPEFKLTFVDEMDSDPDIIAMRKALGQGNN